MQNNPMLFTWACLNLFILFVQHSGDWSAKTQSQSRVKKQLVIVWV